MFKKVLLLNSTYEVLAFISEKKAIRLLIKDKVELLHSWDDIKFYYDNREFRFPATIRMKYYIKKKFGTLAYSRNGVFLRDRQICQFCGIKAIGKDLTIDHLIPLSRKCLSNYFNCITSCKTCNMRKANHLLSEIGMKTLLPKYEAPKSYMKHFYVNEDWCKNWTQFFAKEELTMLNVTEKE